MAIYKYTAGGIAKYTPPPPDTPAVPTGLSAVAGDAEVALDWDDNTELYLERYDYRVNGGGAVPAYASSVTVYGLSNAVEYSFEVRAVGAGEAPSAWSAVVNSTPVAPPTPYVLDISSLGFGHRMIVPGDDAGLGDETLPTLLYCTGAGGTGATAAVIPILQKIVQLSGRPMVIPNGLGGGWGNATDRTTLTNFLTAWGASIWGNDIDNIDFVGGSMGGATTATWAKANPLRVRSVSLFGPVSDIEAMSISSLYTADIAAAYGGSYVEATYGADHNPVTMAAAGAFDGMRWKTWYTESDPICLQSTVEAVLDNITTAERSMMPGGSHNKEMERDIAKDVVAHIEGPDTDTRISAVGGDILVEFWRDGTFTLPSYPQDVRVLVIAGGGGTGGHVTSSGASGGGGGGAVIEDLTYTVTGPTSVVVGRGGMGGGTTGGDGFQGGNGEDSVFGTIIAPGGGGGGGNGFIWASGTFNAARRIGQSDGTGGGGGGDYTVSGAGGVGSPGGDGAATSSIIYQPRTGGGGGAGGDASLTVGGIGFSSDITGVDAYYGGGGAGVGLGAAPGAGGGGSGGSSPVPPEAGQDGLGGGAGGCFAFGVANGGHGRVIVRYTP